MIHQSIPEGNSRFDLSALITERIFLLVGFLGVLGDGIATGAFAPEAPENLLNRFLIMGFSAVVLAGTFFSDFIRKHLVLLVYVLLFGFVAQISYLCYAYQFSFDYALMLHVAIIVCAIYFKSVRVVLIFLVYAFAVVAVSVYLSEEPIIPPDRLLSRLVLALAVAFAIFSINREVGQRLAKSNRQLRLLAENSTDLVSLHKPEGEILYMSPSIERILGYTREESIGRNALDFIHREDRPRAVEAYSEQLIKQQQNIQLEYRVRCKDGTYLWMEVVGSPLVNRKGRVERFITTTRDISVRKQAETEMAQSHESLLQINRELDQFAYVVSHDLKAPLRGISNLSSFIEEDLQDFELPKEILDNLELLRSRVFRMETLIEDILAYSRAGRINTEVEAIDTRKLLDGLVDSLSLPDTFRVELPDNLPQMVAARVPLSQVFSNLITNAWSHHDKDSGTIRISYQDLGKLHEFSVTDDGPGIGAKHHERIFDVFQQLHTTDKQTGTGIGLAIVRKIVRSAGGDVRVASVPGSGASFIFSWPKHVDL